MTVYNTETIRLDQFITQFVKTVLVDSCVR